MENNSSPDIPLSKTKNWFFWHRRGHIGLHHVGFFMFVTMTTDLGSGGKDEPIAIAVPWGTVALFTIDEPVGSVAKVDSASAETGGSTTLDDTTSGL